MLEVQCHGAGTKLRQTKEAVGAGMPHHVKPVVKGKHVKQTFRCVRSLSETLKKNLDTSF